MKLLIVYHAGAMQNARAIFAALAEHCSIELTVVVPQAIQVETVYELSGWLRVEKEESTAGYRMIPVPLRDPANYRKGFQPAGLRRLIAALQPDIIHVFDEPTSRYLQQVAWMRLTAAPDARVLFYGFNNLPISFRRRLEGKFFWPLLAGGAVASTGALENLRRHGWLVERIFWGIATDIFKPMKRDALSDKPLIGYVGRLVPEKGLRVLLEAMQTLPPTLHCLIVGSGPMREELKRFHLIDTLAAPALAAHLNCLDALVVPSLTTPTWKEQFGRVIAEAMACGVPVIGSDSGAIPEVVGDAGVIVPEGDASALAEAIQRVVFDSPTRAEFAFRALHRVETELSAQVMAQRLADFYGRFSTPAGAWRHVVHPIRSGSSLYRRIGRKVSGLRARRRFRDMRRGEIDRCWCGGTLQPFAWHPSYGVCGDCGCYVNRYPPLPEELRRFYSFDVFWHSWYKMKGLATIEDRAEVYRRDGRLQYWLKLIERYGPRSGRVIEIGCSPGLLLAELNAKGYDCIGVEPDERTAAWIREHVGVDIRAGFFPEVKLPDADLALAFDVLEHVTNPEAFVRGLARLLKPGGIAIIQTPIDRYSATPPFKEQFDVFDDIEHLHIFTGKAMQELARRSGFEVVNSTERFRPIHEVCVLRKP